jgi:sec-independent protein translocase protein TatA
MDVGPAELLIILAVLLLLFGSRKLPELAQGLGQAAKELRRGLHDDARETADREHETRDKREGL